MNSYDPQKAARVWQRVQGQQEATRQEPGIQELVMNEMLTASACQRLALQMKGKEQQLRQLAKEEMSHGACLKGMYFLITGERPDIAAPQNPAEPAERLLRRCYGQMLRNLKVYESRREDPEYGHVYDRLARQEREHCAMVLELLGGLGKK